MTDIERPVAHVSCRFTKQARLRTPREFQRVYRQGKQLHSSLFTIFAAPNRLGRTRLGITASRKVSKSAVVRNRCRRRLREVFRRQQATLPVGWDIVINAKFQLIEASYAFIEQEFTRLMEKLSKPTAGGPAEPAG